MSAGNLRVLAGPFAGAAAELDEGKTYTVGYAYASDVVLRDPSLKDRSLTLTRQGGTVRLEVLRGEVKACGRRLSEGERLTLPPHVPVRLGASVLAVGGDDEARWAETLSLTGPTCEEPELPVPLRTDEDRPWWRRPLPAASAGVGLTGVLSAALLLVLGGGAPASPPTAEETKALLAEAGLPAVEVRKEAAGLTVRGFVASDRKVELARRALSEGGVAARVELLSRDALRRTVEDIVMAEGLAGAVSVDAGGRAAVRGVVADRQQVARLKRSIADDVPALREITVTTAAPPPTLDASGFTADVSSVVTKPYPYLTTSDNKRLFVGSVVPGVGEIVVIDRDGVVIAQNGERTRFTF